MEMNSRFLFAKFRKSADSKFAGSFFISEDKEKAFEWVSKVESKQKDKTDGADGSGNASLPVAEHSVKDVDPDASEFEKLTSDFLASMNMFFHLIPPVMQLLPLFEMAEIHESIYQPIAKSGTLLEKTAEYETYQIGLDQLSRVDKAWDSIIAFRSGRRMLPSMFVVGLVSNYDAFLTKLLRLIFITKPEMLSSSERNISFKELMDLGSVEAARETILEKEIESVLRQSHHAQFDWLESKLNVQLKKDLSIWPKFVELCERRNLFTHTDGIVSTQYLAVCASHKVDVGSVKVGDQLNVDPKYLRQAIATITELGLKLVQVVWRKLCPNEIDAAAISLNEVAFDLIAAKRYRLASEMLRFGLEVMKKHGSEATRKRMVVNHANSEKLRGEKDRAEKILDAEDWSATSDLFRMCVAAVKDEVDEVIALMELAVKSDQITKQGFREWPVFLKLRDNPQYIGAFERIFGEPFVTDKENTERPVGDRSNVTAAVESEQSSS